MHRLGSHGRWRVRSTTNRVFIRDFDRWVARRRPAGEIVVGLSSFATDTLRGAASRGQIVVCDRGSPHIVAERRLMHAEAERWGVPQPTFDPWIVDRECSEYELSDAILVPSEASKRSFIAEGIPSERMRVVRYGVDLDQFSTNLERVPGRIICVGRVCLAKGHGYLVEAYRLRRRRGTELVLVGDFDDPLVDRLKITEPDIHLVGAQSRTGVREALGRSSIFVLASLSEGFGLVVTEAMAAGLPVVVSEQAGASDLVNDGIEGFVVPAGDPASLGAAIEKLLDDPERARAMGEAGRRRVEMLGGWTAYGDKLAAVYAGLLGRP